MLDRIEDTMGALVEDKLQRKFRVESLSIYTLEGAFRVFHDYEGALRSFSSKEILALLHTTGKDALYGRMVDVEKPQQRKGCNLFRKPEKADTVRQTL